MDNLAWLFLANVVLSLVNIGLKIATKKEFGGWVNALIAWVLLFINRL